MYSNGEGLGTAAHKSPPDEAWKKCGPGKSRFNGGKRFVRCVCPRCRKLFNVYMMWAGRGMPRKYCADCKAIIGIYDESAMFESRPSVSVPAKKRGGSVTEE